MKDNSQIPLNPEIPSLKEDSASISSTPKQRQKKASPGQVKINNALLLGLIAFFSALFLLFIFEPGISFNKSYHIFTGYIFSIIVALCCWFFLGQIEGGNFTLAGIKIKSANGSFIVLCIFSALWTTYYGFGKPEKVIVESHEKIEQDNRRLTFFKNVITNYADLDIKVKLYGWGGKLLWPGPEDEDVKGSSRYLEFESTRIAEEKYQFKIKFFFPEKYLLTNTSRIEIWINSGTVERTFQNTISTQYYAIDHWNIIMPGSKNDFYKFIKDTHITNPTILNLQQ